MTLDIAIGLIIIIFNSALLTAMAAKRVFYSSPVFFAYACFGLCSSTVGLAIFHSSGVSVWYLRYFLFGLACECLFYFWVLAELGKNLLRFNRKSHSYWQLAVLFFAGTAVLTIALARWAATPSRTLLGNVCFVGMRADGALEFAGFLALISWSSLRKFHWPVREWRIAIGLGFITFVSFVASLLFFQWSSGPVYYGIYRVEEALGLAVMAYWLHYFWVVDKGLPARSEVLQIETGRDPEDSETTQCIDSA